MLENYLNLNFEVYALLFILLVQTVLKGDMPAL